MRAAGRGKGSHGFEEAGMTRYALSISEIEVERYRLMAETARELEADAWKLAGIGPGAGVTAATPSPGASGAAPGAGARGQRGAHRPRPVRPATNGRTLRPPGRRVGGQLRGEHHGQRG